jgi:hypothetical protein
MEFPFGSGISSLFTRVSQQKVYKYAFDRLDAESNPREHMKKHHINHLSHAVNHIFAFCGIPGIGKTAWLNIMFMKAIQMGKTVILHYGDDPDAVFVVTPEGEASYVRSKHIHSYVENLTVAKPGESKVGYDYVYLYDPPQTIPGAPPLNLLSAVPCTVNAYKFVATNPASHNVSYKLLHVDDAFMSAWSWEELYSLRKHSPALQALTPAEMAERFYRFGGSLHTISLTDDAYQDIVQRQRYELEKFNALSTYEMKRKILSSHLEPPHDIQAYLLVTDPPASGYPLITCKYETNLCILDPCLRMMMQGYWQPPRSTYDLMLIAQRLARENLVFKALVNTCVEYAIEDAMKIGQVYSLQTVADSSKHGVNNLSFEFTGYAEIESGGGSTAYAQYQRLTRSTSPSRHRIFDVIH